MKIYLKEQFKGLAKMEIAGPINFPMYRQYQYARPLGHNFQEEEMVTTEAPDLVGEEAVVEEEG